MLQEPLYTQYEQRSKESTCAIQSHQVVYISNPSAVNQTQAQAAEPQKLCYYVMSCASTSQVLMVPTYTVSLH